MTQELLLRWQQRCNSALERALPANTQIPEQLHVAMRYAALSPGKRIRPLLVYATGYLFEVKEELLDAPAVAVELIHAYSLIHDDLPAMDNDTLRRGQPTVHVRFDQATAILAGDALQALAFEQLTQGGNDPALQVTWIRTLAKAAGSLGMCGGQSIDMQMTGTTHSQQSLEHMHALKTGALIQASVQLGAVTSGAGAPERARLQQFAALLGLAFQVRDDILDVESTSATLGKTVGKDAACKKSTFPELLGLAHAKDYLQQLATQSTAHLRDFARNAPLIALAKLAIQRRH